MKGKMSKLLTVLVCIILIPILLVNISIIIQANTNEDEVPSVLGYKPFIVLSGSMESEIFKGDLVIVEVTNPNDLKVDDIIAFRDEQDTVTTHRIIEKVTNDGIPYFVTKGDNNDSQDQNLVAYEDVEGIYKFRIPKVGNIFMSLSEPTTIIIIVLGITVIFGLGFYTSMKKENAKEREEFLEFKRQQEEKKKLNEEKKEKSKKTNSNKSSKVKESSKDSSKKEVNNKSGDSKKKESSTKKTVSKKTTNKK